MNLSDEITLTMFVHISSPHHPHIIYLSLHCQVPPRNSNRGGSVGIVLVYLLFPTFLSSHLSASSWSLLILYYLHLFCVFSYLPFTTLFSSLVSYLVHTLDRPTSHVLSAGLVWLGFLVLVSA